MVNESSLSLRIDRRDVSHGNHQTLSREVSRFLVEPDDLEESLLYLRGGHSKGNLGRTPGGKHKRFPEGSKLLPQFYHERRADVLTIERFSAHNVCTPVPPTEKCLRQYNSNCVEHDLNTNQNIQPLSGCDTDFVPTKYRSSQDNWSAALMKKLADGDTTNERKHIVDNKNQRCRIDNATRSRGERK